MAAVKAGGDRQELHEAIRVHSIEAGKMVKEHGKANDLIQRIKKDPLFAKVADRIDALLSPSDFIGRAPRQVDEFLEKIRPLIENMDNSTSSKDEITV